VRQGNAHGTNSRGSGGQPDSDVGHQRGVSGMTARATRHRGELD
jgi:hypothetical protein